MFAAPVALYCLALAVFAMGTSEFMLAGLVPDLAADLGVSVGSAGLLTSAFAVGMLVGAPVMAIVARSWSPRRALAAFVAVFAASHVLAALADDFALVVATRVVAAVANAGFLAVALSTSARLVPADRQGRALAVLLSGTTAATIVGVPGGAALGSSFGWRSSFWAVAALCLPALAGVLRLLPPLRPADGHEGRSSLRPELAVLRRGSVLYAMVVAALANAATFATFTFLAPMVTDAAHLPAGWVGVVLVAFGVGSFAGVGLAGRYADRHPGRVVAVTAPLALAGWVAVALAAGNGVALVLLSCVQGASSFALGATLIGRVLRRASDAPRLGGAYATAALNAGAVVGPALSAAAIAGGGDPSRPALVSAALVAAAIVVGGVAVSGGGRRAARRRTPRRAARPR